MRIIPLGVNYVNDNISEWVIRTSNWEYNPDKPKKRYNDFDKVADMLLNDYKVHVGALEAYVDILVFAYVSEVENVFRLDVEKVRKFIKSKGGLENIVDNVK